MNVRLVIFFGILLTPLPVVADDRGLDRLPPSEKRVALVIGNGMYQHVSRLNNPPNDARLIAKALIDTSFELVGGKALIDADKTTMEGAIREFGRALSGSAVGLFYYAGHGIQVKGQNYLIPVAANINVESDVKYELVDAGFVLDEMTQAGNRLNMVILDACRNNPFGNQRLRSAGAGLAQVQAPAGTVISYATQPGNTAADGTDSNSPYTKALAESIRKPAMNILDTFNEVGLQVKKATSGQQQPWLSSSPIEGKFYFIPGEKPMQVADIGPQGGGASSSIVDRETVFWQSTNGDPKRCLAYLNKYKDGEYVELARDCVEKGKARAEFPANAPLAATGGREPLSGMEFVRVPGGTFKMGCGSWQSDCYGDEQPVHSVTVGGFEMGKYEVTQGQWQAVMGNNPSRFSSCGDNCPVEQVSWEDVQGFVKKLNGRRDGYTYRLPTEAEWEYACRSGGKEEKYCGGNNVDQVAWYGENSDNKTHPVGQKDKNGLGLYDMSGNVWEWASDWYDGKYYANSPQNNPIGPSIGSDRVNRGGSWYNAPAYVRSAYRSYNDPGFRNYSLGFRLIRTYP